MKLNEEMRESVLSCIKERLAEELPDELLDSIGGGRGFKQEEYDNVLKAREDYLAKTGNKEELKFWLAVDKYCDYIDELPEDAPERLFVLEEWL